MEKPREAMCVYDLTFVLYTAIANAPAASCPIPTRVSLFDLIPESFHALSEKRDSDSRPPVPKTGALPTELHSDGVIDG